MSKPMKTAFLLLIVCFFSASVFFAISYWDLEREVSRNSKMMDDIRGEVAPLDHDKIDMPADAPVKGEYGNYDNSDGNAQGDGAGGDAVVGNGNISNNGSGYDNSSWSDSIDPLYRKVDFNNLLSINPQAMRWLYVPGTTIDNYVMQENTVDEYYYLWRDIYGKSSNIGSLLSPKIPLDLDDAHLLIFGHTLLRTKKVMFYNIINFEKRAYFDSHPYVYLYYPDRTERWVVSSVCHIREDDIVYDIPYTLGSDEYGDMLAHLSENVWQHRDGVELTKWDKTLVLSCCDRAFDRTKGRAILLCKLVDTLDLESGEVIPYVTPFPTIDENHDDDMPDETDGFDTDAFDETETFYSDQAEEPRYPNPEM